MSTAIILAALIAVVALIIRHMVKSKRAGVNLQCGMKCEDCHGHCDAGRGGCH